MSKSKTNKRTIDDQLADFTDNLLEGNKKDTDLSLLDPELRALQETVLRLNHAMPREGPSEAVIQRMRQNVIQQYQQEENKASESSWRRFFSFRKSSEQRWQPQEIRRRQSLALYLATVFLLLLISLPLLDKFDSGQPAASGQNLEETLAIAFVSLALLSLWFFRQKR